MTDHDRITALESQIQAMAAKYQEALDLMQFLGGSQRVFQAATLALIAKHPNKEAFRSLLSELVERAATSVLYGSQSEAHLQGAQDAHTLILEHLNMQ